VRLTTVEWQILPHDPQRLPALRPELVCIPSIHILTPMQTIRGKRHHSILRHEDWSSAVWPATARKCCVVPRETLVCRYAGIETEGYLQYVVSRILLFMTGCWLLIKTYFLAGNTARISAVSSSRNPACQQRYRGLHPAACPRHRDVALGRGISSRVIRRWCRGRRGDS
jgi:hypothetical protein